jgi:hypothetical protein
MEPHFHESDIGFRARYLTVYVTRKRPYILKVANLLFIAIIAIAIACQ